MSSTKIQRRYLAAEMALLAADRLIQREQMTDHEQIGPDAFPTRTAGHEQLSADRSWWVGAYDSTEETNEAIHGPIMLNVDYRQTTLADSLSERIRIEREADRLLMFHDGNRQNIDQLRERTRADGVSSTWDDVVKADRVAYRGQVRFIPNSHKYVTERVFIVDQTGTARIGTPRRLTTFVTGRGYKFIGHQTCRTRAAERAAAQATRPVDSLGTRGKAVDPFTASERTVRRHMTPEQAVRASTLEQVLWTSSPGVTYELAPGLSVTLHDANVQVSGDKVNALRPTFPVREAARRLALAGAGID